MSAPCLCGHDRSEHFVFDPAGGCGVRISDHLCSCRKYEPVGGTAVTEKPMPKKGDRVRVVLEGEVTTTPLGDLFLIHTATNLPLMVGGRDDYEILPPPLPEEPPVGSVVLDKDGAAWQRRESGWRHSFVDCFTWSELHAEWGPLRIIHRGGDS